MRVVTIVDRDAIGDLLSTDVPCGTAGGGGASTAVVPPGSLRPTSAAYVWPERQGDVADTGTRTVGWVHPAAAPERTGGVSPTMTTSRPGPDARALEAGHDRALLARVRDGDAGALEELYARHGGAAHALARRVVVDEGLAQDVVQEVFLAVWRDPAKYDPARGAPAPWLLTMTHHKAVDCVRREESLRRRRDAAELLEPREPLAPDVDEEVWSVLRRERVRAALDGLPAPQREALALAYFGGYTQREIAGMTATPLGTVKTRMLAGMRRMRDVLHGVADSAPDLDGGAAGGLR